MRGCPSDALQCHHDAPFPLWQALDDLEALLLARMSLPNDELKALAVKYPAPRSWYDETSDAPARECNESSSTIA